jgi:hypothetical protein
MTLSVSHTHSKAIPLSIYGSSGEVYPSQTTSVRPSLKSSGISAVQLHCVSSASPYDPPIFLHCIASTRYPYFIASPPTHSNCGMGSCRQSCEMSRALPFVDILSPDLRRASRSLLDSIRLFGGKGKVSMQAHFPRRPTTKLSQGS